MAEKLTREQIAEAAIIQVLILPTLILGWGVAAVTIAAIVA